MNNICTSVVVNILEFFPWLDDIFNLMYLNKTWRENILDVIINTNFINVKTILRLKNKKYILLILKYMNKKNNIDKDIRNLYCLPGVEYFELSPFENVLELMIGSWNLDPVFFNNIQQIFPRLIYFTLLVKSPICIALLKNFCYNCKNLRYIIFIFINNKLKKEYKEKLKKRLTSFFLYWKINVQLITE
ncbi:hypothetical protein PGSY75_0010200 [Plasmodium gaboni]|uniref:Uncharacterized protein n=1 Tax=Plasmodium gaboni TaxID=647221 RepID=A0A151L3L7_9APIC|nr:hypothetical protein PGSY75_0010200 [Plasmodium gaboni]KYN93519.1 hypothetical protein PGSY75_0010200 [Plasmodium gaboni]SOV22716.1 conserved Plasmodium protein, unknown function [Plasmodium sp. DRC-Itaito]